MGLFGGKEGESSQQNVQHTLEVMSTTIEALNRQLSSQHADPRFTHLDTIPSLQQYIAYMYKQLGELTKAFNDMQQRMYANQESLAAIQQDVHTNHESTTKRLDQLDKRMEALISLLVKEVETDKQQNELFEHYLKDEEKEHFIGTYGSSSLTDY